MQPIDGYNADIAKEQKAKLRELFPEVFSEDKIDFTKLKATLGEEIDLGEKYGLSWKGKSSVFAKIQEKTISTLHPQPEESVDWDTTQNMFIEGDNLEALKVLHKAYYGKIKMIYIDPPYNTGNDFIYNDDFKKTRREQALEEGAIDGEGNVTRDDGLRVNTGGHKHSDWLEMMYPRLFLARNLLRKDGVIFVSIDENEVHNLQLILNEIFGEENFIALVPTIMNLKGNQDAYGFAETHEYFLVYARNKQNCEFGRLYLTNEELNSWLEDEYGLYKPADNLRATGVNAPRAKRPNLWYPIFLDSKNELYVTPDNKPLNEPDKAVWPINPDGDELSWYWSKSTLLDNLHNLTIKNTSNGTQFYRKQRPGLGDIPTKKPKSVFYKPEYSTSTATIKLKELMNKKVFDGPKPIPFIVDLLQLGSSKDAIVLDFFSGSGTTAHAVEVLNAEDGGERKWITIQLPELIQENSEAYTSGYKTIADIARERIRRANVKISNDFAEKIAERKTPLDLGFRSYVLGDSNFKKWNELISDPDEIRQATLDSLNPLEDGATNENLLTEILLKRGISPLVKIETHDDFVFLPTESLAISLTRNMTEELFASILVKSPSQIVLLDQAFNGDISLKTNSILQAEKQGIAVEAL